MTGPKKYIGDVIAKKNDETVVIGLNYGTSGVSCCDYTVTVKQCVPKLAKMLGKILRKTFGDKHLHNVWMAGHSIGKFTVSF